jgi:lysozyme family protein
MAASNFEKCLAVTLKFEGGDVHHAKDPGGATSRGVTQATYDAYRRDKKQPKGSVFAMSNSERDEIYREGYWHRCGCDDAPRGVDLVLFDYSVNSGPGRASRVWARAKNEPTSLAQIHYICNERMGFLKGLKTWPHFGRGWTRRVEACRKQAIEMANDDRTMDSAGG